MTHYGASPDEWAQWDLELGLTEDLLPLVCQPGLPIAPTSKLSSYGKVPTILDAQGHVAGIAGWTSKKTAPARVQRWMQQDYGICLQTRRVRALDVDVEDATLSASIYALLRDWGAILDLVFPIRTRPDSSKFLVLFELPGDYPKQTLETAAGMIEFLGTGQQCVVAGTHPKGARYQWLAGLPSSIPVLTDELFRALQAELREWVGVSDWSVGRLRAPRGTQRAVQFDTIDDPVLPYLKAKGLLLSTSPDGRAHVSCPWKAEHTTGTDETASTWFPAGTGGYEQGKYLCLHAHCSHRSTGEFLDVIGYLSDGFEVIGPDPGIAQAFALSGDQPTGTPNPIAEPRFEREIKTGKIYARLQNVVTALLHPTPYTMMALAKDAYTDQLLVEDLRDGTPRRLFKDTDYTELALRLHKSQFYPIPTQMIRDAVQYAAQRNVFDSAIDWLTGLPVWDGTPRIDRFCERYLGCTPSAYAKAVSRYWWTAHAGRILQPGIQADMAIVLISGQGTGKTSSIKAMVPGPEHYVELSLDDRDEDLSRAMRGKLIGEIAELRGLNGRDKESIKAWVSKQEETWVPKYMEFAHRFPRRLVLVGTSNQEEFLVDETGNRRWLPIHVGPQQDREAIARDRNQLWAEAKVVFAKKGILWKEAETLARAEHYQFEIRDPWEEPIREWFLRPDVGGVSPRERGYVRIDEVLQEALHFDVNRIHMGEQFRVGKILKQMGLQRGNKRGERGVMKIWVFK